MQREIGAHVADSLELEILPQALAATERSSQLSEELLATYLRGHYYWQRRWLEYPSNLQRAIDHFQTVVSAAPAFAEAQAALGESYEFMAMFASFTEKQSLQDKARTALSAALALDDRLASAHSSLGLIRFQDWDWSGAEREFREALARDPNSADTHQSLSVLLAYTGRRDEADHEARLAQELDPLSPTLHPSARLAGSVARISVSLDCWTTRLVPPSVTSGEPPNPVPWMAIVPASRFG